MWQTHHMRLFGVHNQCLRTAKIPAVIQHLFHRVHVGTALLEPVPSLFNVKFFSLTVGKRQDEVFTPHLTLDDNVKLVI